MTSSDLAPFIEARVSDLQRRFLSKNDAKAVAELAQLRRGLGKPAGSVAAIWDLTLADIPHPGRGDDPPSRTEIAAHTALTLYASHQQSRDAGMHQPGISLGAAVRRLVRTQSDGESDGEREKAVRRRFDALTTSSGIGEVVQHLRGLVAQLRAEQIPLDYTRLACDLERLQAPGGFHAVRLAWGRAYHARPASSGNGTTDMPPSAPATDTASEEDQ